MKTITRKKGWPKWAKFYAVDKSFGAFVYAKEPRLICVNCWVRDRDDKRKFYKIRESKLGDRTTWRDSLRRIKEPTHAK